MRECKVEGCKNTTQENDGFCHLHWSDVSQLDRIESKLDELLEDKREGDAVHESVCLDVNAYDDLKIYI